jgi:hypothetical protein
MLPIAPSAVKAAASSNGAMQDRASFKIHSLKHQIVISELLYMQVDLILNLIFAFWYMVGQPIPGSPSSKC